MSKNGHQEFLPSRDKFTHTHTIESELALWIAFTKRMAEQARVPAGFSAQPRV